MARSEARALRQPGFAFGKRAVFSDHQLATNFFVAVLGPTDGVDIEELRLRVDKALKGLFQICLQYRELYIAMRGTDIFWKLVTEKWDTLELTDSDDVAVFVETYRTAREKCDPGVPAGELAGLVDEFIEMYNFMRTQGPMKQFQVDLRPSAMSQTTLGLSNLTIGHSKTTTRWPPPFYTEQEVAWLSHDHVLSQVYGLTPQKSLTKASDFPKIPDAYTHPLDIRLFLAFTALTSFSSDRNVSLCMTPVTFWDDDERKDWYQASGGVSKFCWTTWDFAEWAKEEFKRGRKAVVGLSHYHCLADDDEPWKCVGMMIRKCAGGSYEFIMEDAHYHRVSANPEYYKKKYNVHLNTGMDTKAAIVEDIQSHFNISSFWHGGEVPNAFKDVGISLADSVSTSCSFVYLAVQGKVPLSNLDQDGWNLSRNIPEELNYKKENEGEGSMLDDESEKEDEEIDYETSNDEDEGSEFKPSDADDDE
ncbi:hypothetical protein GGS24DRAFT_492978 [Hypoxylon argillaceum]|nr:hypothetical protein GGS24DRAFT_492978 [Hypoxylon argillaceum]